MKKYKFNEIFSNNLEITTSEIENKRIKIGSILILTPILFSISILIFNKFRYFLSEILKSGCVDEKCNVEFFRKLFLIAACIFSIIIGILILSNKQNENEI